MDVAARPFRSVLYIPGSNPRALDKARGLAADAIIFDLEDAVAPAEKAAARSTLAATLKTGGYGRRTLIVRINGLTTPWGTEDIAALRNCGADALLLPKVNDQGDLGSVAAMAPDIPLWAMIETPLGVINAARIAAHSQLQGFVMGTNDLVKELRCAALADRSPLIPHLATALVGAREAGKVILDGVYNDVRDPDGFLIEAQQGQALGFDGKTLVHPSQVEPANEVWAPSDEDVDHSRRVIAAFEEAEAEGRGVITVDGRMIENLHVDNARRVLAVADAIASLG